MNVRQILKEKADKYPEKPAVIFKESRITFAQLRENVLRLADSLRSVGIAKSDRVAIYLPNCPEYIYSYLACFCLGAVAVPLDFMFKSDELTSCLNHSQSKILLAQENNEIQFNELKKNIPTLEKVVLLGPRTKEYISLDDMLEQGSVLMPRVEILDKDPALIMYTSGTTGKPKGILLSYKHLEGSPKAMHDFVDLSENDIKLSALPLSHVAGLIYIQNCINFGISLILMERFNPFEFLKNIEQNKVTCFHIVPAMYIAILSVKNIEKFNLSSLRWVVVFGAPSSPDILNRFHQYCPNAQLLNGWGMTETCPPNTVTPLGSSKIESVGKVSKLCDIRIFDEQGCEVESGQVGEVVIQGEYIFQEYYKDVAATQAVMKDGWFYTGDLGRFDAAGYLYIVGRKKEMIKVGGQIVFAPEVESAFYKHEGVSEVAVIGVPDKVRGEAVKAFIVLKENINLKPEDLRYFAKEHLADFKVPQSIDLCDSLPKNRTGKIDKELLKQGVMS